MSHSRRPSLRQRVFKEASRIFFVWLLLILVYAIFQIGLFRNNELATLETEIQNVATQQSHVLKKYLGSKSQAIATNRILKRLIKKESLNEASVSQSYFSLWPEQNCRLTDKNTEVCRRFFSGKIEVRKIIYARGEQWYLYVSKSISPLLTGLFVANAWWLTSLAGFVISMMILALLFIKLIFIFRKEVLQQVDEMVDVLGLSKSEKHYWLKNKANYEFGRVGQRLFDQQAELEKNNTMAEVGKISSKVAHDVRGPLSLLNVLLKKDSLDTTEIHMARSAMGRIDSIADDLLNRKNQLVEQAQQEICELIEFEFQLHKIVKEKAFQYKNLDIKFEPRTASYKHLQIKQSAKLMRAVENLLDNAIQACGDIALQGHLKLSLKVMDKKMILEFLDTGKGMKASEMQMVAVGQAFTNKSGGNGLGLTTTNEFLSKQSAQLQVWSVENAGSLFRITYPLVDPIGATKS